MDSPCNCALSRHILSAILSGIEGRTMMPSGMPVRPRCDVVSLFSLNVDATAPNLEQLVAEFVAVWAPVASRLSAVHTTVFGVFRLPDGRYSLDLNLCRPCAFRDATLAFARANGQHSIWDGILSKVVETGLSGATGSTLTTPAEVEAAVRALGKGGTPVTKLGFTIA